VRSGVFNSGGNVFVGCYPPANLNTPALLGYFFVYPEFLTEGRKKVPKESFYKKRYRRKS